MAPPTLPIADSIPPAEVRRHAERAFVEMAKRHISPTPANYALWYAYVLGEDVALAEEIQVHDANKRLYSVEYLHHLVDKFQHLLPGMQAISQQAMEQAGRMILDLAEAVQEYSGSAAEHRLALDSEVSALGSSSDPASINRAVIKVLAQLQDIHRESLEFQQQLEASRREADELRQELARTSREARRDFLTGVYNRKAMDELLELQLRLAREQETDLTILLMDIDHFKQFNDSYGHQLGDQVLKFVGTALLQTVRGKDMVARYGGEEFVVVLPETPLKGGSHVAESIRKLLESQAMRRKDTGEAIRPVTISAGVAQYRHATDTMEILLKRADEALYRAKQAGRNRVKREDE